MQPPSEVSGETHPENTQSIITRFEKAVEQFPDSLAVICTHQPANLYGFDSLTPTNTVHEQPGYLRWSYGTLRQSVQRLQESLAVYGLVNDTVFFVFCQNQVECLICTLASYTLGWIHVPISPEHLCNPQEVLHMVKSVTTSKNPAKIVVLANNAETARQFDRLDLGCEMVKICLGGDQENWISFEYLIQSLDSEESKLERPGTCREELSVFFTSGTTSLPKGCLVKAAQWFDMLEPSLSFRSAGPGDLVNVAVPSHHAFGYICMTIPLLRGACVVLTGLNFSPQSVVKTLGLEACTHAALVPTMIHSLMQMLEGTDTKFQSLRSVVFAGMALNSDVVQKCQKFLGISTIENFYGMTEGAFISTGPMEDLSTMTQGEVVSIGKPVPGAQIRVCGPDDRLPVPIGVPGVLHFSGHSMIDHYLDCETDSFYESDGRVWFVTGDQAFVDQSKQLYIVGRQKDMIIRGGENIAPSKIETLLAQSPQYHALDPQVIAGDDFIAGEVPVVVTRLATSHGVEKMMQDTIRENLGILYVPRTFISLDSLSLDDYPRTSSGKIQKAKLSELVAAYTRSQASHDTDKDVSPPKLYRDIVAVWSRVLGIQASHLDVKAPIAQLADSILMLSAREKIRKETGLSVPLPQWLAINTIADQISILGEIGTEDIANEHAKFVEELPSGPPNVEDMVHLGGDEGGFGTTRNAIEKKIAAQGFSWDDVEDVFPCTDFIQMICRSQVVDTWNIRTSIVSQNASVEAIRTALEATLINNPLMLSYIVVDDEALGRELGLHVTLRRNKTTLDRCIVDYGTVETLQDLRFITMNYPFKDHAMLPGPLFRALIVFVRETNSAAVVTNGKFSSVSTRSTLLTYMYQVAHAVLDITYHSLFHEDLDRALGCQPLQRHLSFKAWADTYHTLRKSPVAASGARFHARYLRDLQDHKQVLWPHPTHRLVVSAERAMMDGHVITFAAPSFIRLQRKHPKLTTPIVLKAALALMVILHTNHTHALFLNLEAGRSKFPFVHKTYPFIDAPDAADVAGPTFGGVLNLIAYQPTETVLEYLIRVQEEQRNLTEHAQVPWHDLSQQVGCSMEELLPAVANSLIFNWMPGLGPAILGENPYQNMAVTQTHIRTRLGMLASAGAGGVDGSQIVIFLQGALANMSSMWVERAAEEMKQIALWLAEETSLQMPVMEFIKSVGDV
ncbi:uncharacterized protein N7515_009312 [Penicillium bovifimosum]|uniref:Carrier domain-containing protein n=1 Tax=Penicillium bovifimosum TaxID=126998 RepID=A0A9W9GJE1_9EURO|nr:uncharacterized protein N7515_009312 [Penicillium bovifimosum]KAJ5121351.1 hypothetical protein N7515_009312 [Penicillium bovifimosum]